MVLVLELMGFGFEGERERQVTVLSRSWLHQAEDFGQSPSSAHLEHLVVGQSSGHGMCPVVV